jgi:hypothetical protein
MMMKSWRRRAASKSRSCGTGRKGLLLVPSTPSARVVDGAGALGARWAPGFEPGNAGPAAFADMMRALAGRGGSRAVATWAVHEWNAGPQPQWLFGALDGFLDAP